MYKESFKIHIIEEVLKVQDDATLNAISTVLKKRKPLAKKKTILDFVGVMSKKNVAVIKKTLSETTEKIDLNDWK